MVDIHVKDDWRGLREAVDEFETDSEFHRKACWLNHGAVGERSPHQIKMATAKTASEGLDEPPESSFKRVPRPYASEIDGFATGAAS
jgi:hypothetical protein